MLQKIVILVLSLTVVGAVGVGVYEANQDDTDEAADVLHDGTSTDVVSEVLDSTENEEKFEAQLGAPTEEPQVDPTATATGPIMKGQTDTSALTTEPVQQMAAAENVGAVWEGSGIITSLNDYGFTLDNTNYVELGPPDFWQAQGVELFVGSFVQVSGFDNGEQIHARVVTVNQEQITIRTASGQPLWAGGVNNTNGQDESHEDGNNVPISEWESYAGTLNIQGNNNLTLWLSDGTIIDLQMGQPRFWQGQEIEITSGMDVTVMGYWQTTSFRVGTLTIDETGERLMILDPNGRPLWAGPGGNGNNGNTSHDTTSSTTSATTSTTDTSGQGSGGNGYRGGRN